MKKFLLLTLSAAMMFSFMGCQNMNQNANVYKRENVDSPAKALEILKEGNERFTKEQSLDIDSSDEKMAELKNGQHPFATIVSCSDSRVVSPHIFNQGLGDIFEIKVAGNVLDEHTLGSIEYGVSHLKTPLIVVMGHENCGAVSSTVDINEGKSKGEPEGSNIDSIIESITPSYKQAKQSSTTGDLKSKVEDQNVKNVYQQILKNPIIKAKVDSGEVKIVTAKYMLDGNVKWDI